MSVDFFKNTYFTSDWHVGHERVLQFCDQTRKFDNIEHMHDVLIKNYNNTVKPHQTCYFLGDFAFKGIGYGKQVLSQLHGTKILVIGNHDQGHQSMLNMGFDAVMDNIIWKVSGGGLLITASHFPLENMYREKAWEFRNYNGVDNWHGEQKYANKYHLLQDIGQDIHLHGHIHSPNRGLSEKILGIQYDVGVDANNMKPISLNHIVKEMHRRKK